MAAKTALRRCFGVYLQTILETPLRTCRTRACGLAGRCRMQTHRHREAFRGCEAFSISDTRSHAGLRRSLLGARSFWGGGFWATAPASGAEETAHHRRYPERAADHLVVEGTQRLAELRRRLVALVGIAGERARDHVGEARRKIVPILLDRRYRAFANDFLQLVGVLRMERAAIGENLVEDHRRAPQVDSRSERNAVELLGREVGEFPPQRPAIVVAAQRLHLGDAEVAELDLAEAGDEEVRRRDVAVDDVQVQARGPARIVRVPESVEDAANDVERERDRQEDLALPAAGEDETEIAAVDVLHRDVDRLSHETRLQHLDDVRMLEQARDVRLHGEEIDRFRIDRELRGESLQRHDLAEQRALGDASFVHLRHPAAPEQLQDLEASEARRRSAGFAHAVPRMGQGAVGLAARTVDEVASELYTANQSTIGAARGNVPR